MAKVTGSLRFVLRKSRCAWYTGLDGTTAYYEQPGPGIPGGFYLNGKRVLRLQVDKEGFYADYPSAGVQEKMKQCGLDLDKGWGCSLEERGTDLHVALHRSNSHAATHRATGVIVVENAQAQVAYIFVNAMLQWKGRGTTASRMLCEFGADPEDGWEPFEFNRNKDLYGSLFEASREERPWQKIY